MTTFEASPRESRPIKVEIIAIQRPFSSYRYVSENYGVNSTIISTFERARVLGAKTLLIEDIESTDCLEKENRIAEKASPQFRMLGLRRLTFWSSQFPKSLDRFDLNPHSLLGYAILKCDEYGGSIPGWHVYESILRLPFEPLEIIPKQNTLSISCTGHKMSVSGVLFCGQDALLKNCALTTLRSMGSLALNRDVSFLELLESYQGEQCSLTQGMSLSEIGDLLDHLGVQSQLYDFNRVPDPTFYPEPEQIILSAIISGSGALVMFPVQESNRGHMIFTYGYAFQPSSLGFIARSNYLETGSFPPTLTPWVGNFVGSDSNFGPYFQVQPYSPLLKKARVIIDTSNHAASLDGASATITGNAYLKRVLPIISQFSPYFSDILAQAQIQRALIINPLLMPYSDYMQYLKNVRDWSRNKENTALIDTLIDEEASIMVWVLEFSVPELVPGFQKLGEVVLAADSLDKSSKRANTVLLARFPSVYIRWTSTGPEVHVSHLTDQTPYIGSSRHRRGEKMKEFDYDVALSFAGEDRVVVEQLAGRLKSANVRVFYDKNEQALLWGKDLYQHLQGVYKDRAQYCIVFASKAYAEKLWTKHELKQAQARAFQENKEYILPVRLDDTAIPGINDTTGYIDLSENNVDALFALILEKLDLD